MEHLDARLGTIAAMTPRCRAVADIGCDHGLPISTPCRWKRRAES